MERLPRYSTTLTLLISVYVLFVVADASGAGLIMLPIDLSLAGIVWNGLSAARAPRRLIRPARIMALVIPIVGLLERRGIWVEPSSAVHSLAVVLLFPILGWAMLRALLRTRHVDTDTILGAVAFYLTLPILWTFLYVAIELASPGSLQLQQSLSEAPRKAYSELVYFSLVTLTTLGYGDVVPIHPLARMAAAAEAVVGQLYIAILVARLVALHVVHEGKRKD